MGPQNPHAKLYNLLIGSCASNWEYFQLKSPARPCKVLQKRGLIVASCDMKPRYPHILRYGTVLLQIFSMKQCMG